MILGFERTGKQVSVTVSENRRGKDGDVIIRWTVLGHGVALKSHLDVAADTKAERLIKMELDGWQVAFYPLYLICPERQLIDPLFKW